MENLRVSYWRSSAGALRLVVRICVGCCVQQSTSKDAMTEFIKVESILDFSKEKTSYSNPASNIAALDSPESACDIASTLSVPVSHNSEEGLVNGEKKMAKFQCVCCKTGWFIVDGLGITCSTITYLLIIFAEFVVIGVILLPAFPSSPWSYIHTLCFTFFAFLAAFSHLRAMTTNPVSVKHLFFNELLALLT